MNQVDATNAIKQRILDVFAAIPAVAATKIVFDNEGADEAPTFLRVQINDEVSEQWTLGDNAIVRRHGTIKVKLCVPPDEGTTKTTTAIDYLAKYVRKAYEIKRIGPLGEIVTRASSGPRPLGLEGQHYVSMLDIPFRYDETRASIDS